MTTYSQLNIVQLPVCLSNVYKRLRKQLNKK